MENTNTPQERGTNDVPHFITEEERKALYETVYGENAEEAMKPEARKVREEQRDKNREYKCQKYWLDTYGAKALSPRGACSDAAIERFRARQERHKLHPDQLIGYRPELAGKPGWSYEQ